MGISPEAVRARIQRGTLHKEKGKDGTVHVRLDADQMRSYDGSTGDAAGGQSSDKTQLVDSLEEQISFLRAELVTRNEELRRKDHIIAALTERTPELPAPAPSQEATGGPQTTAEEPYGTSPQEAEDSQQRRSSWWRRFFGFE